MFRRHEELQEERRKAAVEGTWRKGAFSSQQHDESLEKREKVAQRWWEQQTPQRKVQIFESDFRDSDPSEREVQGRERRRYSQPEHDQDPKPRDIGAIG